jgi:hypothetical protein
MGTIDQAWTKHIPCSEYDTEDLACFSKFVEALRDFFRIVLKPRNIPATRLFGALPRVRPVSERWVEIEFVRLLDDRDSRPTKMFHEQVNPLIEPIVKTTLFVTTEDQVGMAYHPDLDRGIRSGRCCGRTVRRQPSLYLATNTFARTL